MSEASNTLTLDGVSHEVSKFSTQVQQAVGIYNAFNAELQKEQLAVLKTQSALQALGAQIAQAVRKELDEAAPVAAAEEAPAAE